MASINLAIPSAAMPAPPAATAVVAQRVARPPRRVLFLITTTGVGGTETVLLQLARSLPSHGIEPLVCSLCAPGRIGYDIVALGVEVIDLGMSQQPTSAEVIAGMRRVARLIDDRRIALVQTLMSRAHVVGTVAARVARLRPVVVSSARSLTPAGARLAPALVRWTRKHAAATVAVSDAVRAEVLAAGRVRPARVVVIRNGVDAQRFVARDATLARATLGLPAHAAVVGAAGRLAPVKGFDVLLAAIARVHAGGLRPVLAIAGEGPQREFLQARASSMGIAGSVRFLGGRRDVVDVYSASDVFALPSLQEGAPNALLEAMACGRAVVATRVGGVPEVVEHGFSGVLVPPNDPNAMADALTRLLSDGERRRRIGEAARRSVLERFDVQTTIRAHAELYHRLLAREESKRRIAMDVR